ncbi:MAG TPA: hypothetical protein VE861_00480 [Gemmatimonadaceae bacterium]|nr:hypothetical protein [Gemmatimonadaceae bacterium]
MSTQPLVAGYAWFFPIKLIPKPPETTPIVAFPAGCALRAEFRQKEGTPVLATLTTADGGLQRVADDEVHVYLPAAASREFTAKAVKFDIIRTDVVPDTYLGVKFTVPVVQPITVTTEPLP